MAEELVAEASGIARPEPVRFQMISRARWAQANVTSLTTMLRPLADKVAPRLARLPMPVRVAQRGLVSAEVGVILGYISRRVLGQYDILVPETGRRRSNSDGAPLYFVGINMVGIAERSRFDLDDFALWVAVHEVTHRFQFAGVPWLKPHFLELVETYLNSVDIESRVLTQRLGQAARRLMSGRVPPEERNPIYLLATDEQRAAFDRIQALMAVVEGHGNYVMDTAGARAIPSFARMREAFDRRRQQASLAQRIINNLIGLETKLRQYELGQSFCNEIVRTHGPGALAYLWESPDHIPSLDELKVPEKWLSRVA